MMIYYVYQSLARSLEWHLRVFYMCEIINKYLAAVLTVVFGQELLSVMESGVET